MAEMSRANIAGTGLIAFGVVFAVFSHVLMNNVPLTAVGIGSAVLGLSFLITPEKPLPGRVTRAIIEGSALSLEMLLEELNVKTRGIYVPGEDGRVYLLVPLSGDPIPPISSINPNGMVFRDRRGEYLVLIPPASEIAKVGEYMNVEDAITDLLVNVTELCENVKVIYEDAIYLEVKKPRTGIGAKRFEKTFGSLDASVAACTAAAMLKKPVLVASEHEERGRKLITLKVYST